MSANFACSRCDSPAVIFCTCEPSRVFLCGSCIIAHRAKPGAHIYVDLEAHTSVQTTEDFRGYLEKTKAVGEVKKCMAELITVLSSERKGFEECWNWAYEDLSRRARALEQVKLDIEALYQQVETEIGQAIEELAQSSYTPALKEIMKSPSHILQLNPPFFAFQTAIGTCYSEGNYKSLAPITLSDIVTSWNLQSCECSECLSIRKSLPQDGKDLRALLVDICEQNPQLPRYQAEEAAVRMQLRGTLHSSYLEPLWPGQKKKK